MFETVAAATPALLLVKLTAIAPGTAGHSSVTTPFTVVPPRTRVLDSVSVWARIGRTVKFSDCETPPKAAVTTPEAGVVTGTVGTVNVALSFPAGTVTFCGTVALLLLFESGTTAPPAGATPARTTRPCDWPHPPMR